MITNLEIVQEFLLDIISKNLQLSFKNLDDVKICMCVSRSQFFVIFASILIYIIICSVGKRRECGEHADCRDNRLVKKDSGFHRYNGNEKKQNKNCIVIT